MTPFSIHQYWWYNITAHWVKLACFDCGSSDNAVVARGIQCTSALTLEMVVAFMLTVCGRCFFHSCVEWSGVLLLLMYSRCFWLFVNTFSYLHGREFYFCRMTEWLRFGLRLKSVSAASLHFHWLFHWLDNWHVLISHLFALRYLLCCDFWLMLFLYLTIF